MFPAFRPLSSIVLVVSCAAFIQVSYAQELATTTHHVSARVPVQGPSRELSAERAVKATAPSTPDAVSPTANAWTLQATLPGAVIHDISFPSPTVGFAAAELGQVWKTTDGGATWTEILNLGFPYYWFGVKALSA